MRASDCSLGENIAREISDFARFRGNVENKYDVSTNPKLNEGDMGVCGVAVLLIFFTRCCGE